MALDSNSTVVVNPDNIPWVSAIAAFNAAFKIVLRGNQTNGLLTIVEDLIYNAAQSRCQIHTREDEVIQVLNGSLQFYLNGYQFCAPAGTSVYIPRNATQSQRTLGTKPIHVQILFVPSGLENYLDQILPVIAESTINQTQANIVAVANGLIFLPEVTWQNLNCAFDDGNLFSLSSPLTFLIVLLYVFISFC